MTDAENIQTLTFFLVLGLGTWLGLLGLGPLERERERAADEERLQPGAGR